MSEKPLEWIPDDSIPMIRSLFFNFKTFFEIPLFTPTQKPAKSYFSLVSYPGCSAVSPPSKAQCEILHPFIIPLIISTPLDTFNFPVEM